MKEVVKASISGIAFTFEQDAYRVMDDYLKKLEAWYARYPDGREIVADIEARIAELILERQESDKVVGLSTAEEIVGQMGYPDEMEAAAAQSPIKEFPRRFYRNPEGAKLAGICSGVGAYFKIDPIWLRLGIFAPLLLGILTSLFHLFDGFWFSLFGFVVLLYFVLWIAVPMAKTPRQKLEMRGERVTADSIRQEFEQTADTIRSEFEQAAGNVRQEFRQASDSARQKSGQAASSGGQAAATGRQANSVRSNRSASVWAEIVYFIGRIFLVAAKIILFFIAFIIGITLISILAAIAAVALSLDISFWNALSDSMGGMVGIGATGFAIIWLLILFIPLFILLYSLIKAIFGGRTSRPFLITSWVIWLMLLIWGAALTLRNADTIRSGVGEMIERIEEGDLDDWFEDRLWLEINDDRFDYDGNRLDNGDTSSDNNGTLPESGGPAGEER